MKRLSFILLFLFIFLLTAGKWGLVGPWNIPDERWGLYEAADDTTATDPRDINADLIYFYRSDTLLEESDTSFPEDGEGITKWSSIEGSWYHADVAPNVPAYTENVQNGKPSARFDGTDDRYAPAAGDFNYDDEFVAGFTFINVWATHDGQVPVGRRINYCMDSSPNWNGYTALETPAVDGYLRTRVSANNVHSDYCCLDTLPNGESSAMITTLVGDTTGYLRVYMNGVCKDSADISGLDYYKIAEQDQSEIIPLFSGYLNGAGNIRFDGDGFMSVGWGEPITQQQRINVEAFIADYYDITLGVDP